MLTAEYTATLKEYFGIHAPSVFLRDLRNYLTHYRLPVVQSRQTFSSQSFSATFILLRQPLLDWSGWKGDVRRWLSSLDEDLEIVPMIDGYARMAGAFDEWLHDRIGLKYASEIREYVEGAEAFNRAWDRVFVR